MPRYKVKAGRVVAKPGDHVEMSEDRAKRFGSRLELVGGGKGKKAVKKKATKKSGGQSDDGATAGEHHLVVNPKDGDNAEG